MYDKPHTSRIRPLLFALLSVAALAAWQALTVHYSFAGNWTALYCTGALFRGVPPELKPENIYIFPNSAGYDGQCYHYLAHDPLFHRNFAVYMDAPRYRGRRILIPGLAFLLAWGQDRWIDPAYLAVVWIFAGLGAYWLARFAQLSGYPAWLGLGFVLVPSVLVSIDRLTVDVALAACCVGFALFVAEDAPYPLYAVLVAAGLSRETGLLLPAACCLHLATRRRWRTMLIFSTTALPVAAWYLYLQVHTPPDRATALLSLIPFSGIVNRIWHLNPYPFGGLLNGVAIALDVPALTAILLGLAWAVWRALQRAWTPLTAALYLFALLTITLSPGEPWADVYAFGRTLAPLLLLAALDGLHIRSILPACAMLLVDPRIGLQLGRQILNVVRGIASPGQHY